MFEQQPRLHLIWKNSDVNIYEAVTFCRYTKSGSIDLSK